MNELPEPSEIELKAGRMSARADAVIENFFINIFSYDKQMAVAWKDGQYQFQSECKAADQKTTGEFPLNDQTNTILVDTKSIYVTWSHLISTKDFHFLISKSDCIAYGQVSKWTSSLKEEVYDAMLIYTENDICIFDPWKIETFSRASAESERRKISNAIRFCSKGKNFVISKHNDKSWLVESSSSISRADFIESIFKPLQLLGLLGGYWPTRGFYFFSSEHNEVSYQRGRARDWSVSFTPIASDVYSWFQDQSIVNFWNGKVKPVDSLTLNRIISLMHTHEDYHRLVFILLEFNQVSQEIRPVIASAALETLANLVDDEAFPDLIPAKPNKDVREAIRKELLKALPKKLARDAGEYWTEVINKKIIDLFNHRPNLDRIKRPLINMKIQLSEDDLNAIKSRNDYLHGRYAKGDDAYTLSASIQHSILVYDIICEALLRLAEFDGPVVNHTFNYRKAKLNKPQLAFRVPYEP